MLIKLVIREEYQGVPMFLSLFRHNFIPMNYYDQEFMFLVHEKM